MNKNTALTAKTFMKMADYDRKILTVTGTITTVLTVSLLIKLAVSAVCTVMALKK